MFETTANIDLDTYFKLVKTAKDNNLKIKDIIHILFNLLLVERPLDMPNFQKVRYQESEDGKKWKLFHLLLQEGMYETCLDLRKLFKMSVSGLLEVGVELYLERAVAMLNSGNDNYTGCCIILKKNTSPLPSFAVFYTIPPVEILNYYLPPEETILQT